MAELSLENVLAETLERAFEAVFGGSAPFGIFSQTGEVSNSDMTYTRDVIQGFTPKDHDPNGANTVNKEVRAVVRYALSETEKSIIQIPREWEQLDYPELRDVSSRVFTRQLNKLLVTIERNDLWGSIKTAVTVAVPYDPTSANGRIINPDDLPSPVTRFVTAVEADFDALDGKAIHLLLEEKRDQLSVIVDAFCDITDNEDYVIFINDLTNRKMTNELAFANNTVGPELIRMGFKNTIGELSGSALFKNLRMGTITVAATERPVLAIIAKFEAASVKWNILGQDLRDRTESLDRNAITEYKSVGGVLQPEQIIIIHGPAPAAQQAVATTKAPAQKAVTTKAPAQASTVKKPTAKQIKKMSRLKEKAEAMAKKKAK